MRKTLIAIIGAIAIWGASPAAADHCKGKHKDAPGCVPPIDTSLVVVDGTGTPFATVLDVGPHGGFVTAVAEIQGFIGLLQVASTPNFYSFLGGISAGNQDLWWTSDDCSGTPYLRSGSDAIVPNFFDVFKVSFELDAGNFDTRLLYVNSGPPVMLSLLSQITFPAGGGVTCFTRTCPNSCPSISEVIPMMLIDPDISMTFPPPYSVQLQ